MLNGARSGLLISVLEKLNLICLASLTDIIDVKMDGFVFEENNLLTCQGYLSILNWIEAIYIISIAKTGSKKIGALICSMKFLSPKVAQYLYRSTIRPCME